MRLTRLSLFPVLLALLSCPTSPSLLADQVLIQVEQKAEKKEDEEKKDGDEEDENLTKEEKKKRDLEKLSKALEKFAEPERKKRTDQMDSVLADLKRAAELDEAQEKELNLAVKGAVERSLDGWRQNYQRYAESRFQSNDDIDEVISRLGRVSFGTNAREAPKRQAVWAASVERILTPEQAAKYQKVVAERAAFQQEAVARSLVAHVDGKCSLTGEQRKEIMELIEPVVAKHFEGLSEIYGGEMRNLYYQLGIFLNGVEKEKPKAILTEQQMSSWDEIASQNASMWESVLSKTKELDKAKKERDEELKKLKAAKEGKPEAEEKDQKEGAADKPEKVDGPRDGKAQMKAGEAKEVVKDAADKVAGVVDGVKKLEQAKEAKEAAVKEAKEAAGVENVPAK